MSVLWRKELYVFVSLEDRHCLNLFGNQRHLYSQICCLSLRFRFYNLRRHLRHCLHRHNNLWLVLHCCRCDGRVWRHQFGARDWWDYWWHCCCWHWSVTGWTVSWSWYLSDKQKQHTIIKCLSRKPFLTVSYNLSYIKLLFMHISVTCVYSYYTLIIYTTTWSRICKSQMLYTQTAV